MGGLPMRARIFLLGLLMVCSRAGQCQDLAVSISNPPQAGVWLNGQGDGASYAFLTQPSPWVPGNTYAFGLWDKTPTPDFRACSMPDCTVAGQTSCRYGFDPRGLMPSKDLPEGDWYLHLCVQSAQDLLDQSSNTYHFKTDNTAPSIPGAVSVVLTDITQIRLSWAASSDAEAGVAGYKVFRDDQLIATVQSPTYTDSGLEAGKTYGYEISAYDAAMPSNESARSGVVTAMTKVAVSITNPPSPGVWQNGILNAATYSFATMPPNAPLSQFPSYGLWDSNPVNDNRACMAPLCSVSGQTGCRYGFNPAYTMSANTLPQGNWFLHLCIQSVAQPTNQGFSVWNFRTDNTAPSIPSALQATVLGSQVNLVWSASSDSGSGIAGYRIFRNRQFLTVSAGLSYADTTVVLGSTYTYNVSAVDATVPPNESALSTMVSVWVPAPNASSGSQTFSGTLTPLVEDDFNAGVSRIRYTLKTTSGFIDLVSSDQATFAAIPDGSSIRVKGVRQQNSILVDETFLGSRKADVLITRQASAVRQPAVGVRRIAIVLVNFLDDKRQQSDTAAAVAAIQTLNGYFQENSYGAYGVKGDVYGYVTLPINSPCSDFTAITNGAAQAITNAGGDVSSYDSLVAVAPTTYPCSQGGLAELVTPGHVMLTFDASVVPQSVLVTDLAHELGHNMGLHHANALDCGPGTIYAASGCTSIEYSDMYDGMAGPQPKPVYYNSSLKEQLGWLAPTVAQTGFYTLSPLPRQDANPRALKINVDTESFYVEYRQRISYDDSFLWPLGYEGALIRLGLNDSFPFTGSNLLNMSPSTWGTQGTIQVASDPTLRPGNTYTDYAKRFSITTLSLNPTTMQVRILVPGPATPAVLFSSLVDGSVYSSTTTETKVSIEALDRQGISKVELYKDGVLVGVSQSPYIFPLDWSHDAAGPHTLMAKAYSASGVTATQTVTVTTTRVPSTFIGLRSPAIDTVIQAGTPFSIRTALVDPSGRATQVRVTVNGLPYCVGDLASGCWFSWPQTVAGTYAIQAQLLDVSGQSFIDSGTPIQLTVQASANAAAIVSLNIPRFLSVSSVVQARTSVPIQELQWEVLPLTGNAADAQTFHASAYQAQASLQDYHTVTLGQQLYLDSLHLAPGDYRIIVRAVDMGGAVSAPVSADVTLVAASLNNVRVYPNPWRSDRNAADNIVFDGLTGYATLKVFTLSGYLVRELSSPTGRIDWNGKNTSGEPVASGIYLYVITSDGDSRLRGKLAIIR